ncbi:metallophosphoesterase family protein [Pedobacter cryoconitis]|uniref:Calcineurin-like phosphoesterase family protein n=1 Tax=Pedobacter cryoconitis TaxID=188932 RepID=A0A327RWM6_9SPHI|nr:metallophosphoesterase [Pedobacter cryoconitis]RAJ19883.1 calcineurin-like phosphoesterase family protein [Pedobacter cryoconitis]
MAVKTLKIAVISDLHCHPQKEEYSENNTLLFSDKLRSPTNEHPVENLLEIIDQDKLEVNLVLSPGDFTHRSDKQGFFSGWSYVNEISRALKASDLIATIGNHDIDSRHTFSDYSFDIPKKISQNFPIKKENLNLFWDTGFTFVEEEDFQILVINSTHYHTHYDKNSIENPAVKGKMDLGQIEMIEKYLEANNYSEKIKIALVHHHPIKHSRQDLGEHDFIENGENMLNVLGRYKFDLIIHGHKHDPWLRYFNTESGFALPILSSGSFSATNQISWISKFNYFHIIEFVKKDSTPSNGIIETWTFKNRIGWKKDKEDGFYPYTGFGYQDNIQYIVEKIKSLLNVTPMLKWNVVIESIPELQNLIPDKMEELQSKLEVENIFLNSKIGLKPKHIYYERD